MEISGTNVETLNKSGLSKEVYLKHRGVEIEINTMKRGLCLTISNGKIVQNGTTLQIIPHSEETWDFENEVLKHEY